ncbi:MAG: ABC transporter ATP-binding protein/permease [Oscillospiraceae bacterium]|nr:ABC transporter ATP-binding protein/permease [Oscillospiraceae bacterium]
MATPKKKRINTERRSVGNILFTLRFAAKYSPLYFWTKMILALLNAAQGFVESVLTLKILLDIMEKGRPFSDALWFMAVFFGLSVLLNLLNTFVSAYVNPRGQEKLNASMNRILYDKAAAIDLSCYDSPEFYNDFVWSVSEANPKINAIINNVANLISSIATVIMTGVLFISLNWVGLAVAAVIVVLGMVVSKTANEIQYKRDSETLPKYRERDYIGRVFYLADYAKEIRLFRMAERLKKDFIATNAKIMALLKKYNGRYALLRGNDYEIGVNIIFGLYLVYLIFLKIVRQSIGFGDIMALFNASRNLQGSIFDITDKVPYLLTDTLYIERLRKFLEYEPVIKSGSLPVPESPCAIEFKNVKFAYNDEPVLQNVSMTIKPGEKIAIVGYNGAGKTTLVKLLMRLYDPTDGEILLDGVNIREYDLAEYRRKIGAVFQDYQIFAATLYDNVVMDTSEKHNDTARAALTKSGFAETLPLETPLTREFMDDGVNLSGGESQKVAIARTFFKSADYMIFDEPSSALDPISEYNVYNAMRDASVGKTVIFISHRLSSTKMADKIYMFENGKIIEAGDHDTLMANNGKYAEMFNMQAEKYRSSY